MPWTKMNDRANEIRPPRLCDSCGKPINLMTGECAGCSD